MLSKKKEHVMLGWLESLVLTAILIVVSIRLHNPLFLESSFPWIWFAPVLIGLRYGLGPAILSIILFLSFYLYDHEEQIHTIPFQLFVLGGFLLTLLCVIYQKSWERKIRYSEQISHYLQNRIQTTAHAYKTALLAYQHLEHSLISKPVTLRSSLEELRELLAKSHDKLEPEMLSRFLNILASNCGLEAAAIFPVTNKHNLSEPIAAIGIVKAPSQNNFLIQECMKRQAITYITTKQYLKEDWDNYLIVAPFIDQNNEVYALLAVQEMPFLKLNKDTIENIDLFVNYFTEGNTDKNADLILEKYPDCHVDFANELQRLVKLQKNTKHDSAMSAFFFLDNPHREEFIFLIKQEIRGIDTYWETSKNDKNILLILMPLSNRLNLESYKNRIDNLLLKKFHIELNGKEIQFKSCLISSFKNPLELIEDMLNIK
jgi:polysaccharide biosynthesis protein PelD